MNDDVDTDGNALDSVATDAVAEAGNGGRILVARLAMELQIVHLAILVVDQPDPLPLGVGDRVDGLGGPLKVDLLVDPVGLEIFEGDLVLLKRSRKQTSKLMMQLMPMLPMLPTQMLLLESCCVDWN